MNKAQFLPSYLEKVSRALAVSFVFKMTFSKLFVTQSLGFPTLQEDLAPLKQGFGTWLALKREVETGETGRVGDHSGYVAERFEIQWYMHNIAIWDVNRSCISFIYEI